MKKQIVILGISAYYHDSASAIMVGGQIVAEAQEERFTRIKGDHSFPHHAIEYCLYEVNIILDQADSIIFYEDSIIKCERILGMAHLMSPKGFMSFLKSMPKYIQTLWDCCILHLHSTQTSKINSREYKLVGLAPYGSPMFSGLIKGKLIYVHEDGTVVLKQKYFQYTHSLETINKEFENLFRKNLGSQKALLHSMKWI